MPAEIGLLIRFGDPDLVPSRSDCEEIWRALSLGSATAASFLDQGRDPALRRAHQMLTAWSRKQNKKAARSSVQSGVADDLAANFFDADILALELALKNVADKLKPLPGHQGAATTDMVAQMVWQPVEQMLRAHGRPTGKKPSSPGIKIISAILKRTGYAGASATFVSRAANKLAAAPRGDTKK
jgi:hypothetical protein